MCDTLAQIIQFKHGCSVFFPCDISSPVITGHRWLSTHAGRLGFAAVVGEGGACVLALLSVSKGGKAFFFALF